jgi:GT2 family glycosyltransferase
MDYHEGFGNNAESLLELEKRLLSEAELTITTSAWLDESISPHVKHRALIRNAGDYGHFSKVPETIYSDSQGRKVVGYYGAIAEWFDLDLVEAVARQHSDCSVLLIGADTINARTRLAKLLNVMFTGEVSYRQLPYYLHGFAVCLLPFKVIPLTLATNPVKAYEYLSAGKPVVSVDLPEIAQFEGLVYTATGKEGFLNAVSRVLSQPEPDALAQKRKDFARQQTWRHRAEVLIQQVESSSRDPKVSVVVVTYNNLDLTRACLASLDAQSQYENMEIIVVDNASSDGSPAFLAEWVTARNNRKLILNDDNRGFAAANNQGLESATGDYLVLLNNDTYVTPGWIRTLLHHLERDKTIGLIGPVTNNIGNEAKIDIAYKGMGEMLRKSSAYTRRRIGEIFSLRTAAFFCVMMPRTTYDCVGELDEVFGRGFFEDDDYCRRIEQLGQRVACAEDVFIHHHLSASFSKLKQQDRQKLFEENKRIYEAKWGTWVPHEYHFGREVKAMPAPATAQSTTNTDVS